MCRHQLPCKLISCAQVPYMLFTSIAQVAKPKQLDNARSAGKLKPHTRVALGIVQDCIMACQRALLHRDSELLMTHQATAWMAAGACQGVRASAWQQDWAR